MNRQEALRVYAREASRERESFLEQRVLNKAGRMSPQEKTKYTGSQDFENTVYQLERSDKAYQGLQRGELVSDYHQTEFEALAPLIMEELEQGNPVSLPFLRSVEKSRLTLDRARAALELMDRAVPDLYYKRNYKRFVRMADSMTERWLQHSNLASGLTQIRIPAGCAIGEFALDGCAHVAVFGTPGGGAEQYCTHHDNCEFVAE